MRKLLAMTVVGALALAVAVPARAELLPFQATFKVLIGDFPGISVTGSGELNATVTDGSHIVDFTVPQGVIVAASTVPVPDPEPLLGPLGILSVGVQAVNKDGAFDGSFEPGKTGLMGVLGDAILFIGPVGGSPTLTATVPLEGALGEPGFIFATLGGLGIPLSISGSSWVTGTATVINQDIGTPGIPATAMGGVSTFLTFEGQTITQPRASAYKHHVFTWVTPTQITVPLADPLKVGAFGVLELHIMHHVPEPGTLLLFGAGFAGLAVIGRRRS